MRTSSQWRSRLAVRLAAACFLTAVLMTAPTAMARDIIVRPDGSGDYPTIQAALLAALDGDTILLADGVYRGDGNRDIDFLGKRVHVTSQGTNAALCIVDCEGSVDTPHRGFVFQNYESAESKISYLTIRNGWVPSPPPPNQSANDGGGIRCVGASPTIEDCVILQNHSEWGGGGLVADANRTNGITSSPTIRRCRFENNTCKMNGGGIATGNDQYPNSNPSITECDFINNSTDLIGGGLYIHYSTAYVANCQFINNHASDSGGGVYRRGAPAMASIDGCVFVGNSAGDGGAVAAYGSGNTDFVSCTFYANVGALGAYSKSARPDSSAMTPKGPVVARGPIGTASAVCTYVGATASLAKCIVSFSPDGAAVDNPYSGGEVVITQCDVFGNVDGPGIVGGQIGTNGNIAAEPLFCAATGGDLTLWSNSPCAADNNGGVLIGALGVGCQVAPPWQLLVRDFPSDQGGSLICRWGHHPNEAAGQSPAVTYYELQRLDANWTLMTLVTTAQSDTYSVTIATPDILTVGQAPPQHNYRLIARTTDPGTNFVSASVSAYSIDNLPPEPPQLSIYDSEESRVVVWQNPTPSDFRETCLYRGTEPDFTPTDPLQCGTGIAYQENHLIWYAYKARSFDIHGNPSEWSNEVVGQYPTDVPGAQVTQLRLYPNHPNPFNPMTTIRFDLPAAGPVRLAVYDLAGRLVRVLVEGERAAGSYEVAWDGRDASGRSAPSGSYLARLVAGGKVEGVRLSLVR